ncbi:uncharacterized protein [Antedon mediterranea]|uniref:uncharacterized protein n=1 Tax=Antedon mediterranea TaxID=105859 RepID=UPI003AF7374E
MAYCRVIYSAPTFKMLFYNFLVIFPLCLLVVDSTIYVDKVACSTNTSVKAVCECTARTVNCANLGLTEWPVGIPKNTLVLDMSNNNLEKIEEDELLEIQGLLTMQCGKGLPIVNVSLSYQRGGNPPDTGAIL